MKRGAGINVVTLGKYLITLLYQIDQHSYLFKESESVMFVHEKCFNHEFRNFSTFTDFALNLKSQ